jgi:dsDNA-binding SOS-regulon protein
MVKVIVWKTNDGSLFEDESEAKQHETNLTLMEELEQLCYYSSPPSLHDHAHESIEDWIYRNGKAIYDILKKYYE